MLILPAEIPHAHQSSSALRPLNLSTSLAPQAHNGIGLSIITCRGGQGDIIEFIVEFECTIPGMKCRHILTMCRNQFDLIHAPSCPVHPVDICVDIYFRTVVWKRVTPAKELPEHLVACHLQTSMTIGCEHPCGGN